MVDRPFAFFIYFLVRNLGIRRDLWAHRQISRIFFHSIEITNLYFKIRSEPQAKIMTWFCVYIFQKKIVDFLLLLQVAAVFKSFLFFIFCSFYGFVGTYYKILVFFFLLLNAASFGGNYSIRRPLTHYNMYVWYQNFCKWTKSERGLNTTYFYLLDMV